MNKTISIMLFMIGCCSVGCVSKMVFSTEDIYTVDNQTNTLLIQNVKPINESFRFDRVIHIEKNINIAPYQKESISYYHDKLTYNDLGQCLYADITIYNLNDTNSFSVKNFCVVEDIEYNTPQYQFIKKIYSITYDNVSDYDGKYTRTLTITDTLLSYFSKDYTMLEKFKDYYSSSH